MTSDPIHILEWGALTRRIAAADRVFGADLSPHATRPPEAPPGSALATFAVSGRPVAEVGRVVFTVDGEGVVNIHWIVARPGLGAAVFRAFARRVEAGDPDVAYTAQAREDYQAAFFGRLGFLSLRTGGMMALWGRRLRAAALSTPPDEGVE